MNQKAQPAPWNMTPQEFASVHHHRLRKVQKWIREGKLRAYKVPGTSQWRIPMDQTIFETNEKRGS